MDLSNSLTDVTTPMLVIGGARNPVVRLPEFHKLATRIASAEVVALPDCGHVFFPEHKDTVLDLVHEFVGHNDGESRPSLAPAEQTWLFVA